MRPFERRSTLRTVGAIVATIAVAVVGGGLVARDAHAGAVVVPGGAMNGVVVAGTVDGGSGAFPTAGYTASTLDGPVLLLSGALGESVVEGSEHVEVEFPDPTTENRVARILDASTGLAAADPIEIAAAQAAVWSITDGFVLSETDGDNDPAVVALHRELLVAAEREVPDEPVDATTSLTPGDTRARAGDPVILDVDSEPPGVMGIEVSDPSVTAHPVSEGTCDPATVVDRAAAPGQVCLTASGPTGPVGIGVRSAPITSPSAHLYRSPAGGALVATTTATRQAGADATVSWGANSAPAATIRCPDGGPLFGEPVDLVGSATDPDGDALTWQWFIDGVEVTGAAGGELTTTLDADNTVALEVSDDRGGSTTATLDCGAADAPALELACTTDASGARDFTATANDPDGDAVSFVWTLDGVDVTGSHDATLALDADSDGPVSVVGVDATGLRSEPASAACGGGNSPPFLTTVCPTDLEFGRLATFEARATDPDGDDPTFTWTVGGNAVDGANGPMVDLSVQLGDTVAVTATDPAGSAATTTFDCGGRAANEAPVIGIVCPTTVVHGHRQVFAAEGVDGDGDDLTYRWFVDGVEVDGQSAATVELALGGGQAVSAEATDGTARSERVTTECRASARTVPPTVSISCPLDLVWGENAVFVANGVDSADRGPLVYTWLVDGVPRSEPGLARTSVRLRPENVLSVIATSEDGVVSDPSVADCAGVHRPSVALSCPGGAAGDGPEVFSARGVDPDSERLVFEWRVDGVVVEGESTPELTHVLDEGSRVSVRAIDGRGLASTEATSRCAGGATPTVALQCPESLVDGEPRLLHAAGDAADGDSLTYTWSVDGEVAEGAWGPTAMLPPVGSIAVTATDPHGRTSDPATGPCTGRSRPVVDIACPTGPAPGSPTRWTATTGNADGTPVGGLTWAVNGVIVPGVDGDELEADVEDGDAVSVNAATTDGLVSETVTIRCARGGDPAQPTTVDSSPVPADIQILGTEALREALAVTREPAPLARTGGTALRLLLVGLAAVAAGLTLLAVGDRPRSRE